MNKRKSWMHKKPVKWGASLVLLILITLILGSWQGYNDQAGHPRVPDSYDYQAIAVNFAEGVGFPLTGIYLEEECYKFENFSDQDRARLKRMNGLPGLHRPPAFGYLCGLFYKLFGVSPRLLKWFFLFLHVCTAILIFWQTHRLTGKRGLIFGIPLALVWMMINLSSVNDFLPGSVLMPLLTILSFIFLVDFFRSRKWLPLILFSCTMSMAWLVGFSLMFVPVLALMWMLIKAIKEKRWNMFLKAVVAGCLILLPVIPWQYFVMSEFAKMRVEVAGLRALCLDTVRNTEVKRQEAAILIPDFGPSMIPITNFSKAELEGLEMGLLPAVRRNGFLYDSSYSTAQNRVAFLEDILFSPNFFVLFVQKPNMELLSCHNELMHNGMIQQSWRVKDSYYCQQDTSLHSSVSRMADFYTHYPVKVFSIAHEKFKSAFHYSMLFPMMLAFCGGLLFARWRKIRQGPAIRRLTYTLGVILFIFLTGYFIPAVFSIWLLAIPLFAFFIKFTPLEHVNRTGLIFLLNFILAVWITYGIERYVKPMETVAFIMIAVMADEWIFGVRRSDKSFL